jgi:hypothetical protein
LAIGALEKPRDRWCGHCVPGQGCGIYEARPRECAHFECGWKVDERLGPEWRPDRCKFLLAYDAGARRMVVHVDANADNWRKEPFIGSLRNVAADVAATGGMVMVMQRKRAFVLQPDREVDLGVIGPDDRIVVDIAIDEMGRESRTPRVVSKG